MIRIVSISRYAGAALLAGSLALSPTAQAAMVTTQDALSAQQLQADRDKVRNFLDRAAVKDKLQALGVDAVMAKGRVDALSDQEVQLLAQKIDSLPAGGALGTTDIILILLVAILVAIVV